MTRAVFDYDETQNKRRAPAKSYPNSPEIAAFLFFCATRAGRHVLEYADGDTPTVLRNRRQKYAAS